MERKLIKFVCEFIIDSYEQDDKPPINLMISIFSQLVSKDLQHLKDFKDYLPKLCKISLEDIPAGRYLFGLTRNLEEEEKAEEEQKSQDEYDAIESFLQANRATLKMNDPIFIAITDQIEEYLEYNEDEDDPRDVLSEEEVSMHIEYIRSVILQDNSESCLRRLVAIAYFKKIAKAYTQDLFDMLKDQRELYNLHLKEKLEQFFQISVSSDTDKMRLYPFNIYIMKLLHSKLDILKMNQSILADNCPWIQKYVELKIFIPEESLSFAYISDELYTNGREAMSQHPNNIDSFLKSLENDPLRRLGAINQLLTDGYFQKKRMQDERLANYLQPQGINDNEVIGEQYFQVKKNIDEGFRKFLMPFLTESSEARQRFIKIQAGDKLHYFKLLQIFLGSASHSGETFLKKFYLEPNLIKDCFVPFVQNIKIDTGYQTKLQTCDNLVTMKCNFCNSTTLAVDLKKDNSTHHREDSKKSQEKGNAVGDHSKKMITLGEKICYHCKNNKFNNGKMEFSEAKNNDAVASQKSYIPLNAESKQQYRELRIRDLSVQELCIGRIIVHNLMMLSLCFSDEQEIIYLLHGTKHSTIEEYGQLFIESINYLVTLIRYDWNTLKKAWCVNDEKVLQIIQSVIIGILREPEKFSYELLRTPSERRNLENNFKRICQGILIDKDSYFEKNQDPKYQIEIELLELNQVDGNNISNLLRLQNRISIKQFGLDLRDHQMMGKQFFKILFEQREIVQSIRNLKYLLKWAMIIYNKYNAQLTIDEARDLTINEIIQRENAQNNSPKEYLEKFEKDYHKFEQAWNSFAGLIIKDDNVEATIPLISRETKIIQCCLTSSNVDHEGHIFFMLLKYLATEQNKLLAAAEQMLNKEGDQDYGAPQVSQAHSLAQQIGISDGALSARQFKKSTAGRTQVVANRDVERHIPSKNDKFPRTHIIEIKKDQIVQFREKEKKEKKRQPANADATANTLTDKQEKKPKDMEKEKFEDIIIRNSSCMLEYGKGKQIDYNISHIQKQSIELLLQGKTKIDFNSKFNFQFVNVGNLQSQFEIVHNKIPQEQHPNFDFSKDLDKTSTQTIQQYLKLLRTIINFVCTSKITVQQSESRITEFMGVLEMQNNSMFAEDIILQVFRLKHIVQLYEELEIRVEEIEIENINHKYLEGKDKDQKLIDVHLASLKEKMKKKKQEALENLENEKSKGNTAALQKDNDEKRFYQEIECIMHVFARFINRQFRNYHQDLAKESIFEYLAREENRKFYIKFTDILKHESNKFDTKIGLPAAPSQYKESIQSVQSFNRRNDGGARPSLESVTTFDDKSDVKQYQEINYDIQEINVVQLHLAFFLSCKIELKYVQDVYRFFKQQIEQRDENIRIAREMEKEAEEKKRKNDILSAMNTDFLSTFKTNNKTDSNPIQSQGASVQQEDKGKNQRNNKNEERKTEKPLPKRPNPPTKKKKPNKDEDDDEEIAT